MKDRTLKMLLGIIALNLTVQTVKDVGLFPTEYAQSEVQKITIWNTGGGNCAVPVRYQNLSVFPVSNFD